MRGDPVDRRPRDVARVEGRRALLAQPLDRVAERRVAPDLAPPQQRAVGRVDRLAFGGRAQDALEQVDDLGLLLVDLDAVAGQGGRGRREVGERDRSPAAHRGIDARRACRTSRRTPPRHGRSGSRRRRSRPRRARAAPDHRDRARSRARRRRSPAAPAPPGAGHEHVAARARTAQQRLGDPRRQHRRDRGIDGVAACAQHVRSRLRGQRMTGGDHALWAFVHGSRLALQTARNVRTGGE